MAFGGVFVEAVIGSELLGAARAVHYQCRVTDVCDCNEPASLDVCAQGKRKALRGCKRASE